MDVSTDIDIDFFDRDLALEGLQYVLAVELRDDERRRHVSGVYFHDIPVDPIDGMAAWDYETSEAKGFFKVDMLNNRKIYADVRDEAHLIELLTTEPPWEVLDDPEIVAELAQIGEHFSVVQAIKPRSIDDLAVCIALVRPGKSHLLNKSRAEIDAEIWVKTDKYAFKRSHAIAYASAIVVQLNLLVEKANGASL